jgi:hypothetical protein
MNEEANMANDRDMLLHDVDPIHDEEMDGLIEEINDYVAEEEAEGAAGADALPAEEVTVVRDRDLAREADNRGIFERLMDTVLQDENEMIDKRSGPSV